MTGAANSTIGTIMAHDVSQDPIQLRTKRALLNKMNIRYPRGNPRCKAGLDYAEHEVFVLAGDPW